MSAFEIVSRFTPQGDQPEAIRQLTEGLDRGDQEQILLGVTGSGKTFTIAKVIEAVNRPTLILSHNKTLAAQLFQEFRSFFPNNAVEYFVSYYDYYQPEAYVPATDTYIEKETSINEEIDRLRLRATKVLFERRDVIIVASVSCIYGLGAPEAFFGMLQFFSRGDNEGMEPALQRLVNMQYQRTQLDLFHGSFRVRGDVLEIVPAYEDAGLRVEYFGDEIERITRFDVLRGNVIQEVERIAVYPKTHYVTPKDKLESAIDGIKAELVVRLDELETQGKLLERQRLEQRTRFDLEMLKEIGYCHGIENYSRHLSGRAPGQPPPTLFDYFPDDFLLVVDESHQSIPQVRGMYHGDRSRKQTLVDFGFRLPSALDNRPLTYDEFDARMGQRIYVSATPAPWELERTGGVIVEQLIRPTGLLDPVIEVRPAQGQVDDLMAEVRKIVNNKERVLVTTLTKRMAEELSKYMDRLGIKVEYVHSDVKTLDRVEILRKLRAHPCLQLGQHRAESCGCSEKTAAHIVGDAAVAGKAAHVPAQRLEIAAILRHQVHRVACAPVLPALRDHLTGLEVERQPEPVGRARIGIVGRGHAQVHDAVALGHAHLGLRPHRFEEGAHAAIVGAALDALFQLAHVHLARQLRLLRTVLGELVQRVGPVVPVDEVEVGVARVVRDRAPGRGVAHAVDDRAVAAGRFALDAAMLKVGEPDDVAEH